MNNYTMAFFSCAFTDLQRPRFSHGHTHTHSLSHVQLRSLNILLSIMSKFVDYRLQCFLMHSIPACRDDFFKENKNKIFPAVTSIAPVV